MNIDKLENKEKIAIIVVGYNRIKSIKRLLGSLVKANYSTKDIPLVISIDCSGVEELYKYVRDFEWPYGEKYLNIQNVRLGLKNHIFQCGDLTKHFKAVILLEDDLYVSPYFYNYVVATVDKYGNDNKIAGIALYKNEINGYIGLPFHPINNGADVFALQETCTWGQCWTAEMWNNFRSWLKDNEDAYMQVDMWDTIKNWSKAWSKYYNAYIVSTNRYFIFPYISLTTNFSDAGVHGKTNNTIVQVNLLNGEKKYELPNFCSLIKYDIYFNNKELYKYVGLNEDELCVDLYGTNINYSRKRYLLTPLQLPYKSIHDYALNLRPHDLNIMLNISGNEIHLYDTLCPTGNKREFKIPIKCLNYHFNINRKFAVRILIDQIKNLLKQIF